MRSSTQIQAFFVQNLVSNQLGLSTREEEGKKTKEESNFITL